MGLNMFSLGLSLGFGFLILLAFFLLVLTGLFYLGCVVAGLRPPNFFKALGLSALAYFAGLITLLIAKVLFGLGMNIAGVKIGPWAAYWLTFLLFAVTFFVSVAVAGAVYNWGFEISEGGTVAMVQFGIPAALMLLTFLGIGAKVWRMQNEYEQMAEARNMSSRHSPYAPPATTPPPAATDGAPGSMGVVGNIGFGIFIIAAIVSAAAGFMLLVEGFKESVGWGLAMLFVPFASLAFVISFWDRAKQCVFLNLACIPVMILGVLMGGVDGMGRSRGETAFNNPADDPSTHSPTADGGVSSDPAGYTPYGGSTPSGDPGYTDDPTALGPGATPDPTDLGPSNPASNNVSDPGGYVPYGGGDPGPGPSDPTDPADPLGGIPDPAAEFPDPGAALPDPAANPGANEPLFNNPGGNDPLFNDPAGNPPGNPVGNPAGNPPGDPGGYTPYGGQAAPSSPKTGGQPLFNDPGANPGASSDPFGDPANVTADPAIGSPGLGDPAGGSPFVPKRKPIPQTLSGKAEWAMDAGRLQDGVLYLCAAALVDDNAESLA